MSLSILNNLSSTQSTILELILFFTFGIIISLPNYIRKHKKKRKEKEYEKKKAIQWLVNVLQKVEDKHHKSFIDWYKNDKDII